MKIRNVSFCYYDRKYGLGPHVDFIGELEVADTGYDCIVTAIGVLHPEYKDIKLMSFCK